MEKIEKMEIERKEFVKIAGTVAGKLIAEISREDDGKMDLDFAMSATKFLAIFTVKLENVLFEGEE